MQRVEENKVNYLVFPYKAFSTDSLPAGENVFILYAYQTMANDTNSFSYISSSVETNDRWRTAVAEIITDGNPSLGQLKLEPGTTYNLELRYGQEEGLTWGEAETEWEDTFLTWSTAKTITPSNLIQLGNDTIFVSGSVSPDEKLYISSNENAVLKIYQG